MSRKDSNVRGHNSTRSIISAAMPIMMRPSATQYIVGFYNPVRRHSTLDYLSPQAYEAKLTAKQPICLSEKT